MDIDTWTINAKPVQELELQARSDPTCRPIPITANVL
jgi:hypothetical protein